MFRSLQLGLKATEGPVGTATARFYVTDHLGTVRVEMADLGEVIATNDYKSYGVALPPRIEIESRLKFTGQERDTFTNYDYMHFRFYASSMGRFLKPDNIIPNVFNPQSWNLYSYVNGNPVNFNDPMGHGIGGAMANPAYLVNITAADWINWGVYTSFYSNLYGGDVAVASGGAGRSGSSSQTYTYKVGKWVISGWFDMWITQNEYPWTMIVYGRQPIWSYVSYTVTSEVTISGGGGGVDLTNRLIPPPYGIDVIGDIINGKGYGDLNISFGSGGFGITAGIMFNGNKSALYFGGGLMSPGVSSSLTYSPNLISEGWNYGIQGQVPGGAMQIGISQEGDKFLEIGIGYPMGASATAFYVLDFQEALKMREEIQKGMLYAITHK